MGLNGWRSGGSLAAALLFVACGQPSPSELTAQAAKAVERGDTATAVVQLKQALQSDPALAGARFLLGQALLGNDDPAGSVVELEKALELGYDVNAVTPVLAVAMLRSRLPQDVIKRFSTVTLTDPSANADIKVTVAQAHREVDEHRLAQEALTAALQSMPTHADARVMQARYSAAAGGVDAALAVVDDVLRESPSHLEALQLKGEVLWQARGDTKRATEALQTALRLNERYIPARLSLMRLYLASKDEAAYASEAAAMERLHPNHPETKLMRAQAALARNDIEAARKEVAEVLITDPDHPRALRTAGMIESRAGAFVRAEQHLARAVLEEPGAASTRRMLADTYARLGQPQRALATLQPLLSGSTVDGEALALAGRAHLESGKPDEAAALFTRAAAAMPERPEFALSAGLAAAAAGRVDVGVRELQALSERYKGTESDLALVAIFLQRGELDRALGAVDRLQQKSPGSPLPDAFRGRIHQQRGSLDAARKAFEKSLEQVPEYFAAIAGLSQIDDAQGRRAEAARRLQVHLAANPRNALAMLQLTRLMLAQGTPAAEVQPKLESMVASYPQDVLPRVMLVDFLLEAGSARAARAAAQAATASVPASPDVTDALARALLAAGDVEQAVAAFSQVVAARPQSPLAHARLANAQVRANDLRSAMESYRRALSLDPLSLDATAGLAAIATRQGRGDDAIAQARRLQLAAPRLAAGHLLEAELHLADKRFDRAAQSIRAAVDREPTSTGLMQLHGTLLMARREGEAARVADTWLAERPRDAVVLAHLGTVALAQQDWPKAEGYFRQTVLLRPEDGAAHNNLAWALFKRGNGEAVTFAERAVALMPTSPAVHDTMASALVQSGKLPAAIASQRRAVELSSGAPNYRLHLAEILLASGDKSGAKAELETLRRLGSAFPRQAEVSNLLTRV